MTNQNLFHPFLLRNITFFTHFSDNVKSTQTTITSAPRGQEKFCYNPLHLQYPCNKCSRENSKFKAASKRWQRVLADYAEREQTMEILAACQNSKLKI